MNFKILKPTVVYLGGLLTGLSLILYPALGTIFTDPAQFGISSNQFSGIFIPQIILAIFSALLTPFFVSKWGMKRVLFLGSISLFLATALLLLSNYFKTNPSQALLIVYSGTSFLGLGFGLVITVLNPLALQLFPQNPLASISGLHFSLGLGTAGAPLLVGLLQDPNLWWYLPLILVFILLFWMVLILFLQLSEAENTIAFSKLKIPLRLWGFIAIVVLYGICEGALGSYGAVFLKSQGLSIQTASFGLALFWGGLALGRIAFGLLSVRFNMKWVTLFSALAVGFLLYLIPMSTTAASSIAAMAIAGICMSSLFPTAVNWASSENTKGAIMVSGLMVASLQLGTGISTNFLGVLSKNYALGFLFKCLGLVAFAMFLLMWLIKTEKKSNE
jgi:MFS transporter, FHS family, glucose/mannose:H+ symporter